VAPNSNAPASEVTGPASNAATTLRPSTGANSKKFGVQSVGIGVLRESEINCCGTTIFADSQPRCTQFGERSALARVFFRKRVSFQPPKGPICLLAPMLNNFIKRAYLFYSVICRFGWQYLSNN